MRKLYPKYKKAQRSSFGDIPEHWKEKRFGFLFHFTKGLGITKENLLDEGIPCISYGEIHSRYGFEVSPEKHPLKCVSEEYIQTSPNSLLKYGDFIFADTSEDIEGSGNFTYYNSKEIAFAGYHTILNKPKEPNHNSRFLAYMFDSRPFRTQIQQEVTGTKVFSITKSILKDTMVLLPPPEEQNVIVNYLDKRVSKIDELISKKNEFIERLKEKRTALISQVVTKGLPPEEAKRYDHPKNPKMKPSGIDWLGDIPIHWNNKKFKYLVEFLTCGLASTPEYVDEENGIPFLSAQNVRNGRMDLSKYNFISKELHEKLTRKRKPQKNDLLQVRVGATIGDACVVDIDMEFSVYVSVTHLRLKNDYDPKYFSYLLNSRYFKEQALGGTLKGGGVGNLNVKDLENFIVPLPPLPEQVLLRKYLDFENNKIEALITNVENAIATLKEYRSAIITAAVTGKIDVRDSKKVSGSNNVTNK